jgi:hypothetical protein
MAKMKERIVMNKGLIFDGIHFNSPIARGRYIGTVTAKRRQWLKDYPGEWRAVESMTQKATLLTADSRAVEGEPTSPPSCPTPRRVGPECRATQSIQPPIGRPRSADNSTPVGEMLTTNDPSQIAKTELEIAGRAYVSAARLRELLGISERTLSRWCADSSGPPHVKIQGVYFEHDEISTWAASRGITVKQH